MSFIMRQTHSSKVLDRRLEMIREFMVLFKPTLICFSNSEAIEQLHRGTLGRYHTVSKQMATRLCFFPTLPAFRSGLDWEM